MKKVSIGMVLGSIQKYKNSINRTIWHVSNSATGTVDIPKNIPKLTLLKATLKRA